jgi:hypothetical protein
VSAVVLDDSRRLGRLSPYSSITHPRMALEPLLVDGYAQLVPETVDWMSQVGSWPMYANDRLSDCTGAMAGHAEEVWSAYGQRAQITVTEQAVIDLYSQASGYNPADPSTDKGAVMQDVYDAWHKVGLAGHRIDAYAELDPSNKTACKAALYFFGTLGVGINFPKSADQAFLNRQIWDYNPQADNKILGGHAMHIGGVTVAGEWEGSTWGRRQVLTTDWWDAYVEEVWVPISREWIRAGVTPAGIKIADANAAYTELTKQPGPFQVTDVPPVSPTPTPAPSPNGPDADLIAACWPWVNSWHVKGSGSDKAAQALLTWRKAKYGE